MEYLRSSHSARIASWILRESVRSCVEKEILGELLRQRRAALHPAASREVTEHGAADADRVDAEMLVEAPVLDRHEGLGQIGRQLAQMHRRAAGVAAIGQERAVVGENGDIGRTLGHRELVDRRQLTGVIGEQAGDADEAPDGEHESPVDQPADEGASGLAARAAPGPARAAARLLGATWRAIGGIGAQVGVAGATSRRVVEPRLDPLRVSLAAPAEHHSDPAPGPSKGRPPKNAARPHRS